VQLGVKTGELLDPLTELDHGGQEAHHTSRHDHLAAHGVQAPEHLLREPKDLGQRPLREHQRVGADEVEQASQVLGRTLAVRRAGIARRQALAQHETALAAFAALLREADQHALRAVERRRDERSPKLAGLRQHRR
jgi:hypothetical protein